MNHSRAARTLRFWVAGGLLCAGALSARATIYHVATAHPNAADDNPGTESAPFKTINGALPHLGPGDEVMVHAGVYREQIILPRQDWHWLGHTYPAFPSGNSYAEMIAFTARAGDEVVLKGSEEVEGWRHHDGAIWVRDDWTHNSQQMFCDGVVLRQIGGSMGDYLVQGGRWGGRKGDGIEDLAPLDRITHSDPERADWTYQVDAAGSFFVDREADKLYVWLTDDRDPNAHRMEVSVLPFHLRIGVDFVRVSGFKMMHAGAAAVVNWSSIGISGNYNILENIDQSWSDFGGIGLGGHNNTVRNCRFNYNGNNGMGGGGWGNRVLNCETSYNNYRNWSFGWHAGGVKMIPYAHDLVMSGHRAFGNNGSGIWFDAWMSNVTIRDSVSAHNRGDGIFYEIGERGVIKNNIVYENAGRGIYVPDSSDTLVAHNVAARNGMSGIVVTGGGRRGGWYGHAGNEVLFTRNNLVWGNVLMDNCHPDRAPTALDGRDESWTTRPELVMPDGRASNYGNLSDYNVFYRSDDRPTTFWSGWHTVIHADLDAWREASGNDRNSVWAEPLFLDPDRGDFRPAPGSAALDRVRPHMSVRRDADARPRPNDRPRTAGAFEAQ